jgi:hypothetical protein
LAPLTTSDKGAPFSSTSKCRFVPFFSPIRRVGADGFLRKRCLDVRPVGRLPEPGDTLHGIVFSQPALPYATKHSRPGPLLKFSMNHRRTDSLKFLSRRKRVGSNTLAFDHRPACGYTLGKKILLATV